MRVDETSIYYGPSSLYRNFPVPDLIGELARNTWKLVAVATLPEAWLVNTRVCIQLEGFSLAVLKYSSG